MPPIGMMDSGVGGLSILRELRRQLPHEDVLYFADQGHVPYGPRLRDEIRSFTRGITRFFLKHDAKVVVIACNSASAAALHHVREVFPNTTFVGMEPAVKPAAEHTRTGVIGVIATQATNQGELFASVVDRFADGVQVVTQTCPDFVALVEAGRLDGAEVYAAAERYLRPLKDAGIDQLVLGCTHFPFISPVLEQVLGPDVTIVDPSPAVVRQTGRVITHNPPDHVGRVTYVTSGNPEAFLELARRLMDEPVKPEQIYVAHWIGEEVQAQAAFP